MIDISEDKLFKEFVIAALTTSYTRQQTINFLKSRYRYYEGIAGALSKLRDKRVLTQAEELRRQTYNEK